jgi:hypothetical protein
MRTDVAGLGADLLQAEFLPRYRWHLTTLGFTPPVDVSQTYGIGALVPSKRRRPGVYLLVLNDGLFYIGRAKDVVRRFAALRKTFGERLIGFTYQEVAESKQPEVERALIQRGERAGLPLRQTEWTSQRHDEADLDALFTPQELAEWGEDPVAHLTSDSWPLPVGTVGQQALDREKFERLLAHPVSADVLRLVANYVQHCVPFLRRTAPGYWTVACLPGTNRSTFPRLACEPPRVWWRLANWSDEENDGPPIGVIHWRSSKKTCRGSYGFRRNTLRKGRHRRTPTGAPVFVGSGPPRSGREPVISHA